MREQFEISSVVYLDKHSKTPPVVSIVAHVHPASAKHACKTVKETFCFDTPYEKDEFCRLLHVAIMLGYSSFKAFQRLADDRCPFLCLKNGHKRETLKKFFFNILSLR